MKNNVVVTGLGVAAANGIGIPAFTQSLKTGISGINRHTNEFPEIKASLADYNYKAALESLSLTQEERKDALRLGARVPLSTRVSLATALEAWHDAFADGCPYPPEQRGIIIAGHNVEQKYQYQIRQSFIDQPEFVPASYALYFMDTNQLGLISELLTIRGEGCTVGGASASGNSGIIQAYRQVASGITQSCLVVGAMADLSPPEIQAFKNSGALLTQSDSSDPAQLCRPFDQDRKGFVYGQGCACLLLENEQSARERHAPIWGQILGGSICLDANRGSNPSCEGESRVMQQALLTACCPHDSVDYINTHGTSSLMGDETEIAAIKRVFGPYHQQIWLNSTKSLTGHCLYAAAAVETVATLIQMKERFLHPNLNLETPINDECRFVGQHAQHQEIKVALNNAFGFGGINTCVVLAHASQ
ncbi:beta-ketoacyl synthase N-terminal-like domain-containing protein [Dickeya solani]|uniref:Beta-ketoacyl synthase N-terminal-like domain-containing protein n=1 Tax=Dickeya solani TaxID=1089444 RepID=A0AAX4F1U4_9GAMM|nr:beta-ketoacyl synthase N-terminal-like domain-containing protein [Dickeya solani]WOA53295.1 beta-ketoacyl synthase N-terminal-like domain-containing protein [Dickeya solani]